MNGFSESEKLGQQLQEPLVARGIDGAVLGNPGFRLENSVASTVRTEENSNGNMGRCEREPG